MELTLCAATKERLASVCARRKHEKRIKGKGVFEFFTTEFTETTENSLFY